LEIISWENDMRKVFVCFLGLLFTGSMLAQSAEGTPKQPVLDTTSMDATVDPCTDFYAYSCGGWMKKNPIPPDQSDWGAYSKLQDETLVQLRTLLETAAKGRASRSINEQKIGDYYAACMDAKVVETLGAKPLAPALSEIAAFKNKRELATWVASAPDAGIYFFRYDSMQDFRDSTQQIAELDQGGLGLPDRDFYFKDDAKSADLRKAYAAHVEKMFELLGDGADAAKHEADTVMRIETALAAGSQTRVERRDPHNLDHMMQTTELAAKAPEFAWSAFFGKTGTPEVKSLNVDSPGFVAALDAALKKESLADWKTYLRWHLVHSQAQYLASPFMKENFNFYGKTLRGQEQMEPRWKKCVSGVDGDLGEALGQVYVEKYFSPEAKQRAQKMVKEIQAAMERDLQQLPWMSDTTKKKALEKLHGMANKIGYPEKWRDYGKLAIVAGDYAGNGNRGTRFEYDRQLAKIGKPLDRGEWGMTPPTVNAYYNGQMNDINFPAGVLQPPVFDIRSDDAPNYGDTGGTIGHELTHGFDDQGRQFDATGNLKDWWTPEDGKEFEKRAACISDQYSGYTIVDDIKINGKLTLGEDTADLGGLILAYMAWKDETKDQKLEPMDGLTPEQRFFVGYGQSWCTNERDEIKRVRATTDPHSPEKYRTNGVVSNMPEFQEAFHCKAGAPMVRKDRCRVW
jgi:endothelin-converting enzyme/putative endopeptidase